jgi:zinc D-Ala-D-Ala carboxypeptidase
MTPSYWPSFTLEELKCHCGKCGSTGLEMKATFMDKLQALRNKLGFPMNITSGYRCPAYNASISHSGSDGVHTTGQAVDIAVRGEQAYLLIKAALEMGFTGVGIDQEGASRFVHLDIAIAPDYPRPTIWSY